MKKATITHIALLAFAMNVMLPFFAIYNLPAASAHESSVSNAEDLASLFGDKVLICTPDGFKWVSWKDLNNGKEHPHSEFKCPLCYVGAQGMKHAMPSAQIGLVVSPGERQYVAPYSPATEVKETTFPNHRFGRAPPPSILA